jgi:hypothetical protein
MNGYKIVLLKAILCFIGCRKVNGYAPEYVKWDEIPANSSGCIVYIRFRERETVNTNTFHFFAQNRYFFEIRNHYPDFANIAVNAAKRADNNV